VGPRSGGRASPLPVARPFRSWPPFWWSGPFPLRSLSGPACLPGGLAVVGRFAPGFQWGGRAPRRPVGPPPPRGGWTPRRKGWSSPGKQCRRCGQAGARTPAGRSPELQRRGQHQRESAPERGPGGCSALQPVFGGPRGLSNKINILLGISFRSEGRSCILGRSAEFFPRFFRLGA